LKEFIVMAINLFYKGEKKVINFIDHFIAVSIKWIINFNNTSDRKFIEFLINLIDHYVEWKQDFKFVFGLWKKKKLTKFMEVWDIKLIDFIVMLVQSYINFITLVERKFIEFLINLIDFLELMVKRKKKVKELWEKEKQEWIEFFVYGKKKVKFVFGLWKKKMKELWEKEKQEWKKSLKEGISTWWGRKDDDFFGI